MKLSKNDKEFELHPEHSGPAVCVDVTTPKKVDTAYGPKEKFSIVFETEALREDGTRFPVWASGFTPSLHEKASLRKFLKSWFGRDLTAAEQEEFETESLIGRAAHVTIVHNESDGRTFANIALIRPDKSALPLKPSGKFIRQKDRKKDGDSNFARVPAGSPQVEESAPSDWRHTKVHVGKHAGLELMDLDRAAVEALITRWLPDAKALPKPKADDKRLITALEQAAAQMGFTTPEEDNIPY
jgi:hypothetical protein